MPTQEQRSRATRDALVAAAAQRFEQQGYAGASLAGITRAAGVSKGAFYHHFDDKQALFEAVFVELEQHAVDAVTAAIAAHPGDPWQQAMAGLEAFLTVCTEPRYRRVVLGEGPVALGPARWRELDEQHLTGLLHDALARLVDAGLIDAQPLDLLTRSLFGFLTELALAIAQADDHWAVHAAATGLARRVIGSLAPDP